MRTLVNLWPIVFPWFLWATVYLGVIAVTLPLWTVEMKNMGASVPGHRDYMGYMIYVRLLVPIGLLHTLLITLTVASGLGRLASRDRNGMSGRGAANGE